MRLNELSDIEIAQRMADYIKRVNRLMDKISPYLNSYKRCNEKDLILTEYKLLKDSIREDAHWLSVQRNECEDDSILQNQFRWSIPEAAAFGFTASTNSKIDYKLYDSLAEAEYKLTKFVSLEEWGKLAIS